MFKDINVYQYSALRKQSECLQKYISGNSKADARKTTVKGAWHRGIGDEWTRIISGDGFSSIVHP